MTGDCSHGANRAPCEYDLHDHSEGSCGLGRIRSRSAWSGFTPNISATAFSLTAIPGVIAFARHFESRVLVVGVAERFRAVLLAPDGLRRFLRVSTLEIRPWAVNS